MNGNIKILGINGSPSRDGLLVELLSKALESSKQDGAETKLTHLVDHPVDFFAGKYNADTPKGYGELFKLLEWADGIIFASPVYWFSMSSIMKNFIEHITTLEESRGFALEGKVAGFITTCDEDGGQKVLSDMAAPLIHMGLVIPPYTMLFHNRNMAEKSENGWQQSDQKLVGLNVSRMAKILSGKGKIWGY